MSAIEDLRRTMARLRAPDGCPWDQAQTHQTLARCLIDEVSELLDTIDRQDLPHMREELGDVLIQIVFHAQLAEERGDFNFDDVAREINEKLIRRHPHVFGDHGKLGTADEVITKWEQIKAQEKKNGPAQSGLFKPMPPRLPALMFAEAVVKQIEKKALPAGDVLHGDRIARLANDLTEETAGRRLFELAAACRLGGIDPESALRKECDRVMREVEAQVAAVAPNRP
ncbi:MAG: MazG family protein [Lacunisphaera sp.]|nr:MazG family protein [Lacunisphaera sp.]